MLSPHTGPRPPPHLQDTQEGGVFDFMPEQGVVYMLVFVQGHISSEWESRAGGK